MRVDATTSEKNALQQTMDEAETMQEMAKFVRRSAIAIGVKSGGVFKID